MRLRKRDQFLAARAVRWVAGFNHQWPHDESALVVLALRTVTAQ
jgi:hypothetical protein